MAGFGFSVTIPLVKRVSERFREALLTIGASLILYTMLGFADPGAFPVSGPVMGTVGHVISYLTTGVFLFWLVQLGTIFVLAGVASESRGQLYTEDGLNVRIARAFFTRLPPRLGRVAVLCIGLVLWAVVVLFVIARIGRL